MEVVIAYKRGADKLNNLGLTYTLLVSDGSFTFNIKSVHCWLKLLFLLERKVIYFHAYMIGKYLMDIKVVEINTSHGQKLSVISPVKPLKLEFQNNKLW